MQKQLIYKELLNELSFTQCKLLIVSKNRSIEDIKFYYDLGHRDFGENHLKELAMKSQHQEFKDIRWHYIGHLQSNKVKDLAKIPNLFAIHSVSSLSAVDEILKRFSSGSTLELFYEMHISSEPQKSGFHQVEEVIQALQLFQKFPHTKVCNRGLMGMAPLASEGAPEVAMAFEKLVFFKEQLKEYKKFFSQDEILLSMGMSSDYKCALKMGSHWVRVGSKLF
jgi:pyridoxal phosphate enzyme (YggS family)